MIALSRTLGTRPGLEYFTMPAFVSSNNVEPGPGIVIEESHVPGAISPLCM
jgi:hypothetical protein